MSFLTPLGALFVLAAVIPAAALVLTERRADAVRRVLRVPGPGRRALLPVAIAIVLLPALVAVAAAQPVVVRQESVSQRADAQAFVLFDTSLSMDASSGPGQPTRLDRAKRLALRLEHAMPDLPFGIASMTDRSLPNIMPTVDRTLFDRTVEQSVAVDRPPPSQQHEGRATTFDALAPVVQSNFFSPGVQRRLLVVFTDGESAKMSPLLRLELQRRVAPIFVHVWADGERIYHPDGKPDPNYIADPQSTLDLTRLAAIANGQTVSEHQFGQLLHDAHDAVGDAQTHTFSAGYARVPLAPWFVLAALAPLAFLLWRRNA
jgi:hypothetical protein